ncbi:hypothetical protein ACQKMI_03220 [Lysinibacillus sp. NPDC097214]|uniref:hypothetical protein n=1 Tax=Lysinibacillus sp. NPDC097214 TaxID=3390584 RepID=UPI003D030AA9
MSKREKESLSGVYIIARAPFSLFGGFSFTKLSKMIIIAIVSDLLNGSYEQKT